MYAMPAPLRYIPRHILLHTTQPSSTKMQTCLHADVTTLYATWPEVCHQTFTKSLKNASENSHRAGFCAKSSSRWEMLFLMLVVRSSTRNREVRLVSRLGVSVKSTTAVLMILVSSGEITSCEIGRPQNSPLFTLSERMSRQTTWRTLVTWIQIVALWNMEKLRCAEPVVL